MSGRLLDGKALARTLNQEVAERVRSSGVRPGLAVILVGQDPASQVYVRRKGEVAERLGFHHVQHDLPADVPLDRLLALIDGLAADAAVHGILVQLPLPRHLDARVVLDRVPPHKDVDGFHPVNTGLLWRGRPGFVPCTPLGVLRLLEHAEVPLAGMEAVVVGRSDVVGKPMAALLVQRSCTVTVCHSRTKDLAGHVARADLVVAAVGVPGLVKGAWVREGAVVVDVGINRRPDGALVGDVEYGPAAERAAWITPVPGGVGPMTIAMLMENTLRAACAGG